MTDGTESTLIIHPTGQSDLTMDLTGGGPAAGTTPYIVPLQSLNLNEQARLEIVYDQAPPGEGGRAVGFYGPLVPVTFAIIIKSLTRGGMIDAYNALQIALINARGGTIEYKPEGVGAGVESTFYHYVKSQPPRLSGGGGDSNRWDAEPKADSMYTLLVETEWQTQPIATSDPDSPSTLSEMSVTIENWVDSSPSQTNQVDISAANLKGTMPALLRILARPGSSQYMGRLIVYRRSEGTLSNFVSLYEAEDAITISPSVAWAEVADSARGDGAYMRCLPSTDANGVAQGRRFTIANPDDHEGRFAVFGIGYDGADMAGVWTHQAQLVCGNITQSGRDDYDAISLRNWQLIYVGEFELPPTPLSDSETGYDTGPFIDWYSTRASGNSQFKLDAIFLAYVAGSDLSPSALDVPCDAGGGVANDERLLVENFLDGYGVLRELAHVVAQSDGDFLRVLTNAPKGDFLTLDPTKDHSLIFAQERYSGVIVDDNFTSYKQSRWMFVADFESLTDWSLTTASQSSDNEVEGDFTFLFPSSNLSYARKTVDLNLEVEGRFGDDDYIAIVAYCPSSPGTHELMVYFGTLLGFDFYYVAETSLVAGWNFLKFKKSQFLTTGSPDWADINTLYLRSLGTVSSNIYVDYWRIEKADPDDADNPNATGAKWDFQPVGGVWTVTEDVSDAGATLACLDVESGVEKSALIDETTANDVEFRARVMAKRDAGYAGILWRAGDDTLTEGAEDCYAAVLDITNDVLLVREYVAGAITQHDNPAFTSAVDTWYVIGVTVKGSTFRVYATAATNLNDDDDVFAVAYLLSTVADATHATGKCGVMSITTLGRFDEVKLTSLQDKMIPADEITLEGAAIFRTIAPFRE